MGKTGAPGASSSQEKMDRPQKIVDKKGRNLGPSDFPHILDLGTDVSAKFKGAFCEARVMEIETENVEIRITLREQPFVEYLTPARLIRGKIHVGENVHVQFDGKFVEAQIQHVKDLSRYKVVFNDGDEKSLRRNQMVLKGAKHFDSQISLDNLPLDNPDRNSSADNLDLFMGTSRSITRQLKAIYQGVDPDVADSSRRSRIPPSEQSSSYTNETDSEAEPTSSETSSRPKKRKYRRGSVQPPTSAKTSTKKKGRKDARDLDESEESEEEDTRDTPKKKPKTLPRHLASTSAADSDDSTARKEKQRKPGGSSSPQKSKSPADLRFDEGVLVIGRTKLEKKISVTFGVVVSKSAYIESTDPQLLEASDFPVKSFPDGRLKLFKAPQLEVFSLDRIPVDQLGPRLRKSFDMAMKYSQKGQLPEDWPEESIFGPSTKTRKAALASRKRTRSQSTSSAPAQEPTPSTSTPWHKRKEVREQVLSKLGRHYEKTGQKLSTNPQITNGLTLDLVHLFRVVKKRGGFKEMSKSLWNAAVESMDLKGTVSWDELKEFYAKHLESFENQLKHKKDPIWLGDKDKKREKKESTSSQQKPQSTKKHFLTKSQQALSEKQQKKQSKTEKSSDRKTSGPSVSSTGRSKDPTDLDEEDGHVPADIFSQLVETRHVRAAHFSRFYSARVVDARRVPTEVILRVLTKLVAQIPIPTPNEVPVISDPIHVDALTELGRITMVFVHYCGWNNRHDEWVTLDRLKISPETKAQSISSLSKSYNFPVQILEAVHNFYVSKRITEATYNTTNKREKHPELYSLDEDESTLTSASAKKKLKDINQMTIPTIPLRHELASFLHTDEGFAIPEVKPEKIEKDAYDEIPFSEFAGSTGSNASSSRKISTPETPKMKKKLRTDEDSAKKIKLEEEASSSFKQPKMERQNSKKDEGREERKRKKELSESSKSSSSTPSSPNKEKERVKKEKEVKEERHRESLKEKEDRHEKRREDREKDREKREDREKEREKREDREREKREEKERREDREKEKEKRREEREKKREEERRKEEEKQKRREEEKAEERRERKERERAKEEEERQRKLEKEKEKELKKERERERESRKEEEEKERKLFEESPVKKEEEPDSECQIISNPDRSYTESHLSTSPEKSIPHTDDESYEVPTTQNDSSMESDAKSEDPLSSLNDTINSVAHQIDYTPTKKTSSPNRTIVLNTSSKTNSQTSVVTISSQSDVLEIPPPQFSPTPPSASSPLSETVEKEPYSAISSNLIQQIMAEERPSSSKSSASSNSATSKKKDEFEATKRELMRPLLLDMNVKSPTPQLPSHASRDSSMTMQSTVLGLQNQVHAEDLVQDDVIRQFEVPERQLPPINYQDQAKRRKKDDDNQLTGRDVQQMLENLGLIAPPTTQPILSTATQALTSNNLSLREQIEQAKKCEQQLQTELIKHQLLHNQLQIQQNRDHDQNLLPQEHVNLCAQALTYAQRKREQLEQQLQIQQLQTPSTSANSVASLLQQTHLTIAQLNESRRQQAALANLLEQQQNIPHRQLQLYSQIPTFSQPNQLPGYQSMTAGFLSAPHDPIMSHLPNSENIRMSLLLIEQQYGRDIAAAVQHEFEGRLLNQLLTSLQQATPAATPPQPTSVAASLLNSLTNQNNWNFSGSMNPQTQTLLNMDTFSSLTPSTDRTATPRTTSVDIPSTSTTLPQMSQVLASVNLQRIAESNQASVVVDENVRQEYDALVQQQPCEDCGDSAPVFQKAPINTLPPNLRNDILDYCAKQQHLGRERKSRPQQDTSGMTRQAQKHAVEKRKLEDQMQEMRESNGNNILPIDPRFQELNRVFDVPSMMDVMNSIGFNYQNPSTPELEQLRKAAEERTRQKPAEEIEQDVRKLLEVNNIMPAPRASMNGHSNEPEDYEERKRRSDQTLAMLRRNIFGMTDLVEREQTKVTLANYNIQPTDQVDNMVIQTQEELERERVQFQQAEAERREKAAEIDYDRNKIPNVAKGRKLY